MQRHLYNTFLLWMLFWLTGTLNAVGGTNAPIDSLLHRYEQDKGRQRLATGQKLMALFVSEDVFFNDAPQITDNTRGEKLDMAVRFGAERYYTKYAYYAEALSCNEHILPLAEKYDQEMYATLLCDKSYCLFKTSDYSQAIEVGQSAIEVCQKTQNTLQLSRAYLYLSIVNHALRDYDEAKMLVDKSIETNDKLGVNMQTHNVLGVACEIYCSAKETDKAIEYGLRAVEAARQINFPLGVANHLTQLSYAYDRKGNYEKGLAAAEEAIDIVKNTQPLDRNQLAISLEFKGWNLLDLGRHQEAAEVLQEAIRLEEEVGNTHAAWNDYRTLAEAYEAIDPHKALGALRHYITMSDSIHSAQMKELMSKANAEFHNDELQEENKRNRQMNRIIISTLVVILLLLLIAILSLSFAFQQKKRSAQMLQQLTEARAMFFTHVTHEFRTPLTVILGIGHEMSIAPECPDKQLLHRTGEFIERQGKHLLNLVNQLLDITKIRSGLGAPKWTYGDITKYISMIVETFRGITQQKNLKLTWETDHEGIMTGYVADYVQKVVSNLLSNAIKFTPEGGAIHVSCHRIHDTVQLVVQDTGIGISQDQMPNIFTPFYQADSSAQNGSGIGLALVKQIIDATQGKISVSSEEGKGTRFLLSWTIKEDKNIAKKAEEEMVLSRNDEEFIAQTTTSSTELTEDAIKEHKDNEQPSILIVEDNADVAAYIEYLLDKQYDVHFATNGLDGLQQACDIMPDVIITDVMMPQTDGLELCRQIRANEATNHIPIIVITAKATEEDRINGYKAGADAYLYKPFNAEELRVHISNLLQRRNMLQQKYSMENTMPSPENEAMAQPAAENLPHTYSFTLNSKEFLEKVKGIVNKLMPTNETDVERVASELCMTSSQLRRKMNAITGTTPKKYILNLQLEAARQLLNEHPERTLADVAQQCGFYDQSHLIRAYRSAFGVNPRQHDKNSATIE